jgi:polysaccharide biosynthesis protein PslG
MNADIRRARSLLAAPASWRPLVSALLGAVVLASCSSPLRERTSATDPARSSAIAPWRTAILGLCEDYPEETRSLEHARADLAAARAAGAQILRIAFGWDAMEPQRGRYDWSFWDDFVRIAVEEFGLRLIPYACYTPTWAAQDQGENFWRSPPREPEDFARFMTALVNRYKHAIHSWELWNEPDNQAYWLGSPAEFAALVRAGSRAVRAADPRATIVLGGIAGETDFLDTLFSAERIAPHVDVVNIHSYFETWHPDPIETLPCYVERVAEIVREHGENEPLWMAETGYSSVGGRAAVSDVYRARYRGEHTDEAQAAALVRTAVLALATGRIPLFAWYRINDLPTTEDVIGDDNNRHLGVRTLRGDAKPAMRAFGQLTRLFAQPYRVVVPEIRSRANMGPPAEVRAFELRDGSHVIAAWLGMPPSKKDPALSNEPLIADPRHATLRVRLPGAPAATVAATNALGQPVTAGKVAITSDQRSMELELTLQGGELLLGVITPRRAGASPRFSDQAHVQRSTPCAARP